MLWVYIVAGLVLSLVAGLLFRSMAQRKARLAELPSKCSHLPFLHVVMEAELGLLQDTVSSVARLMDMSSCPTKLQVHILEPVYSVKAPDTLTADLETACSLAKRYSTFFRENVQVHKVHYSRKLHGLQGLAHILQLQRSLVAEDLILWVPPLVHMAEGWDAAVRQDLHEALVKDFTNPVLSYPLLDLPESQKDIDRFFVSEPPAEGCFFILQNDLLLHATQMARPSLTPALGLSIRHPLLLTMRDAQKVSECGGSQYSDLALSLCSYNKLGKQPLHGSAGLGFRSARPATSPELQLKLLVEEAEQVGREVFDNWAKDVGITFSSEGELEIFGQAYLGMSSASGLAEVLSKWGSEAAFETEKEALKYG